MMRFAFVLVLMVASPGYAEDYCDVGFGRTQALPKTLAAERQADFRGGIAVTADGKPHAFPAEADAPDLTFTYDEDGLNLVKDDFFPALHLNPYQIDLSEPDFELPGESVLLSAELLQPETVAVGLPCDPRLLAQFVGQAEQDDNTSADLRIFAFGPEFMVMVIRVEGGGQTARAVFDLKRAGKP